MNALTKSRLKRVKTLVIDNVLALAMVLVMASCSAVTPRQVVYDVDPMVLHIADHGSRYIKMTAHLVLSDPALLDELKRDHRMVSDCFATVISSKGIDNLAGKDNVDAVKKEILQKLKLMIDGSKKGTILDLYFSEYLIQ